MELVSSIMLFILYILGRLMIWNLVGEPAKRRQITAFSPSLQIEKLDQLDIRCWSKVSKPV